MTGEETASSSVLRIYTSPDCPSCRTAERLAATVRRVRPRQHVELVDLAERGAAIPGGFVGTPTYRLGNVTIALGNPSLRELLRLLDTAAAGSEGGR